MKALFLVALMFGSLTVNAAQKTYQVTGPVLELTDTSLVIQKGKEKWEVSRDAASKITGDLKVGSKVTVEYTMAAKSIAVKK